MITIPNSNLHQKHYDDLVILWEAIFLELDDKRLVGFISPEEYEDRISLVRNSNIAEKLYDMLNLFGEQDFYEFIKPALIELKDINPNTENYLEAFIKCFGKL